MKATEHYLLGFDARERWLPPGSGWAEGRRQEFLYRLDVEKPLSVDTMVWRSVFEFHPELRPPYSGFYALLFEDLERLEKLLATAAPDLETYDLVALGLNLTTCDVEERTKFDDYLAGEPYDGQPASGSPTGPPASGPPTALCRPTAIDASWQFLGYDVSDLWCLTGLMNMGFRPRYDDAGVEALRAKWGPHLNASHLFDDPAPAEEFKNFSNQRVKEHAPFYVIGIWLIRPWP